MADEFLPDHQWYRIRNAGEISSPALLVYPDRIERNILKMIEIAGSPGRLRPHVKTHKMAEIVGMQMKHGISRFKCATVAEAEMAAGCGAQDILLAYQPVGPNIERFFRLKKEFKSTGFSCISDCNQVIIQLSEAAVKNNSTARVWLDINIGMNRTGAAPGKAAEDLVELIHRLPGLKFEGLHAYDGHIHEPDYPMREKLCDEAFEPVLLLAGQLENKGGNPVNIVAGGSPTFPIHAKRNGVEMSPGTTLLWDWGYAASFRDLGFLNAAVLLTRVISKPADGLICIDLGHKALGSEMPQPRAWFGDLGSYTIVAHNEEHMVIRTEMASSLKPGDVLYGIPVHICATVDRYDTVSVVNDGLVTEEWNVAARRRKITI
jgi:D-serine deaminase-like pyridoxal phosphate-dependent protein